jgi:hypothetical protein
MPYKRFYETGEASGYPRRATTPSAPAVDAEKNKNNEGGGGNRQILKRFTLHRTGATSLHLKAYASYRAGSAFGMTPPCRTL